MLDKPEGCSLIIIRVTDAINSYFVIDAMSSSNKYIEIICQTKYACPYIRGTSSEPNTIGINSKEISTAIAR